MDVLKPVPEIIDPVFAKTSQNARFLLSENERFGLVFVKTGSINSGTDLLKLDVLWVYHKRYISIYIHYMNLFMLIVLGMACKYIYRTL
jgi:hypothetical protein